MKFLPPRDSPPFHVFFLPRRFGWHRPRLLITSQAHKHGYYWGAQEGLLIARQISFCGNPALPGGKKLNTGLRARLPSLLNKKICCHRSPGNLERDRIFFVPDFIQKPTMFSPLFCRVIEPGKDQR